MVEKANRKDNRILQVKISEELKAEFDKISEEKNINKSALIRNFIAHWIKDEKQKDTNNAFKRIIDNE
jgi:metal-responsive CopG/Arc/MetJ family transcriptional regulator